MSELLLGVDAGGTSTVALLAGSSGAVLGRGVAGPGNVRALGIDAAAAAIAAAVDHAREAAGLPALPVTAACLGVAGAGRPAERSLLERWAAARGLAARVLVCDDARLVLAAGLPHGWGVALIAGTGSIALGRAPDGATARAGGWGHILGDEGSGRDIALAGLRAACRAADGRGPGTALLAAILGRWGLARAEDLVPHVYESRDPRALLADVPPLVAAAAESGDAPALAILGRAAAELADAAESVARRLRIAPPTPGARQPAADLPLALAGGVLVNTPLLRAALLADLARRGIAARPTLVADPAVGALALARALLGDTSALTEPA